MSIADHFEQISNTGNVRAYDARSARRQFSMSLVLVVVAAVAASGIGFVLRFDQGGPVGSDTMTPPAYAGSLTR